MPPTLVLIASFSNMIPEIAGRPGSAGRMTRDRESGTGAEASGC